MISFVAKSVMSSSMLMVGRGGMTLVALFRIHTGAESRFVFVENGS